MDSSVTAWLQQNEHVFDRRGKTREPLLHHGSWAEGLQPCRSGAAQQTTVIGHQTHPVFPVSFQWNDFVPNQMFVSRD